MKRLWSLILASKLSVVIRLACLCAGLSLFFMVLLVLVKIPLFLVLGVGVAHAFGILGVLLFGVAVLKETLSQRPRSSLPPPKDTQSTT
jgi:hypothetical protein